MLTKGKTHSEEFQNGLKTQNYVFMNNMKYYKTKQYFYTFQTILHLFLKNMKISSD